VARGQESSTWRLDRQGRPPGSWPRREYLLDPFQRHTHDPSPAASALDPRFVKQSFNADTEHLGAGVGQLAFSGLGLFAESDEAREGVAALAEKRTPGFSPYRTRASA
jgi:hypothetical protein